MDEFLSALSAAGVRSLLIGGQAMRLHGMPRFSMDWDFFIPPRDAENFARLNAAAGEALEEEVHPLGPRGEGSVQTFQIAEGTVQFHLLVPGVPKFDLAEAASVVLPTENGVPVRCLSAADLLAAKLAANRPQDQSDIAFLRARLHSEDS